MLPPDLTEVSIELAAREDHPQPAYVLKQALKTEAFIKVKREEAFIKVKREGAFAIAHNNHCGEMYFEIGG